MGVKLGKDMFTDDFLANPIEPLPLENREAIL